MNNLHWICFLTALISGSSWIEAQQPYIRKDTGCMGSLAVSNSTSAFGYHCNGVNRSCQAYLTFASQPPYDSVAAISALLGADPVNLSNLNSVSENATFETNKVVLVPVTCSCAGQFYQANGSYALRAGDTYTSIELSPLEGLSTCRALRSENSNIPETNLVPGLRINVPVRCACPTKNQSDDGVKFLLSYMVESGDYVSLISEKFGADTEKTLAANGLSDQDTVIYPNTTLLVPLQSQPSITQISAQSPAAAPPPPPPPPPPQDVSKSSSKTWKYVLAGVLGGLGCLGIVGGVVFLLCIRKREKRGEPEMVTKSFEATEKPLKKKLDEEMGLSYGSVSDLVQSVKMYTFEEMKSATENFSPSCLIRGSVYRGTINGDFAAIKKINGDVSKEINLLSKINHFNLISLSGICFNDGDWYLVFEYAENGALSDTIHPENGNDSRKPPLTWAQRVQIGLDVATGLNYLHSYTSPPHVHKDLKSSNVLLDSNSRAKITNFGLSRSADAQEGEFALTRHIVGTKGYMAPEYLYHGLVSPKLDVYAFGVLTLEILTGKDIAALQERENIHLSELLLPVLEEENGKQHLTSFLDPSLQGRYPADVAVSLVRLIDSCIKKDASSRPNMDEIVRHFSIAMTTTSSWELSSSST
ncbi:PREDICTED: lysM domain receptor-like kinase 4 [Ipomoea nil]|uniref:lysM domain receptor-like kinase 4 n=1 Tax=Ipomoea nil TaxID=35883 RepID=UPI00090186EA|nr:PREDICTED: lysM domain receptor-like kinase 4 [Ipomoea nil]